MWSEENAYLFKFAWKSIRRNAGRSFFISFSVSLAVFIAVWVVAFFDGLNHQIEMSVVQTNTGFFQFQEPHYAYSTDSSTPLEFSPYAQKLTSSIIKSFSPELILDGNISTPEGSTGLNVMGIHPPFHQDFLPIKENIQEGEFLNPLDDGAVIVGKEFAHFFKFQVGNQIVLNYQDINGQLRSEILKIKGIFKFNGKGFEKKNIYINQKTWQNLYLNEDTGKILFNRIPIMTRGLVDQPIMEEKVKGTNLKLKTWKNINPEMGVILEFHDGMIRLFFLIIGITIIMTILTPVQMLWQERFKELKMLNILGVSSKKFWKIGLFEIVQMIILSSSLASLILIFIIGIQSHTGIDFRYMNNGQSVERAGIMLPSIIYPQLTFEQIIITFIFVIIVIGTSYMWSIHRTLKKFEVTT